jgi:hypothetical protein
MLHELYNNLIFERQKNLPQSSLGTRVGIIGLKWNRRCRNDHAMMFNKATSENWFEKVDVYNIFQRRETCIPWFFTKRPEYEFSLFLQHCSGKGQIRRPCWNTKSDSERFPSPYWQLRSTQFEIDERKIGRDPAYSMGSTPILTRYCTLGHLVFRVG